MNISKANSVISLRTSFSSNNRPKTKIRFPEKNNTVEISKEKRGQYAGTKIGATIGLGKAIIDVIYDKQIYKGIRKSDKIIFCIITGLAMAAQTALYAAIGAGIGTIVDAVKGKTKKDNINKQ